MTTIWDEKHETMPRAEMSELQGKRLASIVNTVYNKVEFYHKKFDTAGVKPEQIKSLDDIQKLPFTTKTDMREVYPWGLLAVDKSEIIEIHTSSGTTGTPVVDAYTRNDIALWAEVMTRTLVLGEVTKNDIIQNAYGYGLFTGGLGIHHGGLNLGATVIPISGGNTKRQLQVLRDFKPTVLTCTPSYALYLAEAGREEGMDFKKTSLRVGFFGAEPWSENMRKEIEANLHIKALDIFGLTEIIGPGVGNECIHQCGIHLFEDVFYPEIINPETGKVLPDGEKGELVFTTLTKEGTPVIRYRTRDITFLNHEKCKCGRTSVRMNRILGRTDDMLIIRGVNVFPSQIEEVLLKLEGIEPHYQLIVDRREHLDVLEVQVEMNDKLFSDEIKNLAGIEKKIESELYKTLNIHTKVKLAEPKSIPRSEGKAKRIVDKRTI
ncbi:MAG: phenylacetate--CoA ligase [Elusimicrobiota bacterium]